MRMIFRKLLIRIKIIFLFLFLKNLTSILTLLIINPFLNHAMKLLSVSLSLLLFSQTIKDIILLLILRRFSISLLFGFEIKRGNKIVLLDVR
jgi:hypothetical protein